MGLSGWKQQELEITLCGDCRHDIASGMDVRGRGFSLHITALIE